VAAYPKSIEQVKRKNNHLWQDYYTYLYSKVQLIQQRHAIACALCPAIPIVAIWYDSSFFLLLYYTVLSASKDLVTPLKCLLNKHGLNIRFPSRSEHKEA